jgi:hypothetical protein
MFDHVMQSKQRTIDNDLRQRTEGKTAEKPVHANPGLSPAL